MANDPIYSASAGAAIGGAVTGATSKSILFIDSSAKLAQDNALLAWDDANGILNLGAHATPPTHAGIVNVAGAGTNYASIDLVGKAQNTSTDTEGMRLVMYNNSTSNRQLLFTDSSYSVSNDTSTHCALRVAVLSGTALIDAVSTDASSGATLNLGNVGSITQLYGTGISVNASGATPTASAQMDVASTTKGWIGPRMTTTQKNAISSPAEGLQVYDTSLHKLCVYTGSGWETVTSG